MIKILAGIVDTFTSLISFFISSIESLLNLIVHIPEYLSFITGSITVLPSVFIPFILASLSLYIVVFVLGRNFNG